MNEKKLQTYNFIKLIMMIMVVIYHSSAIFIATTQWGPEAPVNSSIILGDIALWLNTIHIYTFVAVSGYVFYYLFYQAKKYNSFKYVIGKKVQRLLVPYASACIFWVVPFYIFYYEFDVLTIIKKYFFGTGPSQLWFLLMLFWVFVFFMVLCQKIDFCKAPMHIVFVLLLGVSYVSIIVGSVVPNLWQILTAFRYLIFFYIGMCLRREIEQRLRLYHGLIALIFNIFLYLISNKCSVIGGGYRYISIVLNPFISIAGVIASIVLISIVSEKINLNNRVLKNIEESSMVVYLLHQQLIYVSISIFNRVDIIPEMLVIMNIVIGFGGSYLIYIVLKKFKVTRGMFAIKTSC